MFLTLLWLIYMLSNDPFPSLVALTKSVQLDYVHGRHFGETKPCTCPKTTVQTQ